MCDDDFIISIHVRLLKKSRVEKPMSSNRALTRTPCAPTNAARRGAPAAGARPGRRGEVSERPRAGGKGKGRKGKSGGLPVPVPARDATAEALMMNVCPDQQRCTVALTSISKDYNSLSRRFETASRPPGASAARARADASGPGISPTAVASRRRRASKRPRGGGGGGREDHRGGTGVT